MSTQLHFSSNVCNYISLFQNMYLLQHWSQHIFVTFTLASLLGLPSPACAFSHIPYVKRVDFTLALRWEKKEQEDTRKA